MCIIHCTLSTTQHSGEYYQCQKHIQQITAADMHWRIKSFVHWKNVHLVHGLGTCFQQKIWTESASLGSKLQRIF